MQSRKGFTLIEILVVVAIIGILSSVVLVGLAPAQKRGRDARRLSDLKQVQTALELYYGKFGHYPGDASGVAPSAAGSIPWNNIQGALTLSGIGVNQISDDPSGGKHYQYATNAGGSSYVLAATLEQDTSMSKQGLQGQLPDGVTGIDPGCGGQVYCTSL